MDSCRRGGVARSASNRACCAVMILILLHAIESFTSLLSIEHGVLGRCCTGKQLLRHAIHLLRLLRTVSCQVSWSLIQEEIRASGVQIPRAHSL